MKTNLLFIIALLLIATLIVAIIGCKDDVTKPTWPGGGSADVITPSITSVVPPAATAGVNRITILGHSFGDTLSDMDVYFNSTLAEKISGSDTAITVWRPNMADPAALLKFRNPKAYKAINVTYRVDQVLEKCGFFVEGVIIADLCLDGDTVYAANTLFSPVNTVYKVTPLGQTSFTTDSIVSPAVRKPPTDLCVRNGMLYWMGSQNQSRRQILRVDLSTKITTEWITVTGSGRVIRYGDFGPTGYFYGGGNNTGLCTIKADTSGNITPIITTGYNTESILTIHVFNGYVYVASRIGTTPVKIYRHLINGANLDPRELVLDMATVPVANASFRSRSIKDLAFSSSGTMFVITDALNPILVYTGGTLDYFYKDILSHAIGDTTSGWFGKQAYWHTSNNLYMIGNDTVSTSANTSNRWNILKIDMGTTGSTQYQ
jgi:hypothetical protein